MIEKVISHTFKQRDAINLVKKLRKPKIEKDFILKVCDKHNFC